MMDAKQKAELITIITDACGVTENRFHGFVWCCISNEIDKWNNENLLDWFAQHIDGGKQYLIDEGITK